MTSRKGESYSVDVALSFTGHCHLAIGGRCITRHPRGLVVEDKAFFIREIFCRSSRKEICMVADPSLETEIRVPSHLDAVIPWFLMELLSATEADGIGNVFNKRISDYCHV